MPGPWVVEYRDERGHLRTEKVNGSRAKARNIYEQRIKTPSANTLTVGAVWPRFLGTRNKSTAAVESRYWELRLESFFSALPLAKVTREHLLGYIQARRGDGLKDSSIGREVAILRGIWTYATLQRLVSHNPFVKLGVSVKKREPINKYLTAEEWALLYDHLPGPTRDFYAFVWETAARKKEAAELTRGDVDRERRIAWIRKGKGSGGMEPLFLSDRALSLIDAQPSQDGTIFRSVRGAKIANPRPVIIEAAEDSGLNDILRASGRSAINGVHYLRHAAISRWVLNGEDLAVVARLARHTSVETTMRYVHLAPERMLAAVNR